jgi:hypothetical protein
VRLVVQVQTVDVGVLAGVRFRGHRALLRCVAKGCCL